MSGRAPCAERAERAAADDPTGPVREPEAVFVKFFARFGFGLWFSLNITWPQFKYNIKRKT